MKSQLALIFAMALLLWALFAAIFIGIYSPTWLPAQFVAMQLPKTMAELGDSFSLLDGLFSSLALVMGLWAVLIQVRQQADSNVIGGLSVRQQFLLAECARLEAHIQELKTNGDYDPTLFKNMVDKKKRLRSECEDIDGHLRDLLAKTNRK